MTSWDECGEQCQGCAAHETLTYTPTFARVMRTGYDFFASLSFLINNQKRFATMRTIIHRLSFGLLLLSIFGISSAFAIPLRDACSLACLTSSQVSSTISRHAAIPQHNSADVELCEQCKFDDADDYIKGGLSNIQRALCKSSPSLSFSMLTNAHR